MTQAPAYTTPETASPGPDPATPAAPPPLPSGDYAILEMMGHRTMVGRVSEVERFGTKMLSIEPLFAGALLDPVLLHGQAIYQFTPCSAEVAEKRMPRHTYQLPASVVATLPPSAVPALPTSDATCTCDDFGGADEEQDPDCPIHRELPF